MKLLTPIKGMLRMFRRARYVRKHGFRKYKGTPEEICRQIIEDTYDKEKQYFRVSNGHFCEFYVRDFAFCAEALVRLGYGDKVKKTLEYALRIFEEQGRIRTLITPDGYAAEYPSYGPDSLALLLYTITHTKNEQLAKKHHAFLQREVDYFVKNIIDPKTRLPYAHKRFTSMRDQTKRKASCYDTTMIAVAARECKTLGLRFPYTEKEMRELLITTYWNGTYFFDDLKKQDIVIGDANTFPFWTGIITQPHMREEAMTAMQAAGLDRPFPLRYVSVLDKDREKRSMHFLSWFAKDYETDSVWMHMGLTYVRVLMAHDKTLAKKHLESYRKNIARHKTFLEIYDRNGEPFHTFFYWTDEGMLWCANYLALKQE